MGKGRVRRCQPRGIKSVDFSTLLVALSFKACRASADEMRWPRAFQDILFTANAPRSCRDVLAKVAFCCAWARRIAREIAPRVGDENVFFVVAGWCAPALCSRWLRRRESQVRTNFLKVGPKVG